MTEIFTVVVFIIVATVVSGLLLVQQKDSSGISKTLSYFLPFSTGMLISLCITEFIPQTFKFRSIQTDILLLFGIMVIILIEKYILPLFEQSHSKICSHQKSHESSISKYIACSSIGCILVCAFFDGLTVVSGFGIGCGTGLLVSSGMVLHTIPEGVLVASMGVAGGLSNEASRRSVIFVGFSILLGAVIGMTTSSLLSFQRVVLPIASGVLLYVSIGQLLPISLKNKFGIAGLLAGMAIIFLLKTNQSGGFLCLN